MNLKHSKRYVTFAEWLRAALSTGQNNLYMYAKSSILTIQGYKLSQNILRISGRSFWSFLERSAFLRVMRSPLRSISTTEASKEAYLLSSRELILLRKCQKCLVLSQEHFCSSHFLSGCFDVPLLSDFSCLLKMVSRKFYETEGRKVSSANFRDNPR